jgi:hypothetical protein
MVLKRPPCCIATISDTRPQNGAEFPNDFNASLFALIRRMRPRRGAAPAAAAPKVCLFVDFFLLSDGKIARAMLLLHLSSL